MFSGLRRRKTPNSKGEGKEDNGTASISSETPSNGENGKRYLGGKRTLFVAGILVGTLIAGSMLVNPIPGHLEVLFEQYGIPAIPDLDLSRFEVEWMRFKSSIPEPWKLNNDGREFKVGESAVAKGFHAKHPTILVPGIVSTGLESWSTSPEFKGSFREKIWGGFHMIAQAGFNREKWIKVMMLDPETGLDPPGVRLRAVEGIDAATSFVQGYWIWSKIIENLAVIGYDTNNLHLAAYDWRLSFWNLEERDGYFSRLKTSVEGFKKREGRKIVIIGHSMGATVVLYFLKWVEAEGFGNGGPNWVEDHLEAVISIGGTFLGVPKAMTAFLSGEMRDTVAISPAGAYVLERFFSKKERAKLFRSWAGSASMWMKGGEAIWGNATFAPDDLPGFQYSHGQLLAFRGERHPEETNLTADAAGTWILEHTPVSFQKMLYTNYSYGIERDEEQLVRNDLDHRKWSNPLEIRLPYAPSLKMYCVYGHGKDTERSYWYARGAFEREEFAADLSDPDSQCDNTANGPECTSIPPPLDAPGPMARTSWIDSEMTIEEARPKIMNGVKLGEGDGTVALISLGGMCVEGWKRKRWNPAGVKIITHELLHQPTPTEPRGGANTSDHIDILGSTGLNELVVNVVSGHAEEVPEQIISKIREYAVRMGWD